VSVAPQSVNINRCIAILRRTNSIGIPTLEGRAKAPALPGVISSGNTAAGEDYRQWT